MGGQAYIIASYHNKRDTSRILMGLESMCMCLLFEAPFFSQQRARCCQACCTPALQYGGDVSGWPVCHCSGPVFSPGILLPLAHFILLLLLPCGTLGHTEPRLSHIRMALLHSTNDANYI